VLDSTLREISGLSLVPGDSTLLAANHDEAGEVIFLRKTTGVITCKVPFRGKGDFEGIELGHKVAYAIKSDGDLYTINLSDCNKPQVTVFVTGIPKERDVESLTLDTAAQQLIFVTKEDPKQNTKRSVYAVGAVRQEVAKLLFEIDPVALREKTGTSHKNYFSPSGITIDPISDYLWIISSASKELAVFDRNGMCLAITKLDKEVHQQPEGICFDHLGNLYISNEAKSADQPALISYFKRI
jgi:uncharacterized protein YjiK